MSLSGQVDLSEVPISALRDRTRHLLELSLNEFRVIPTDEGIPRDWRGLAYFTDVNTMSLAQSTNRFSDILNLWTNDKLFKGDKQPSLKDLQDIFGQIDRWDIYDDTEEMMLKDAEQYLNSSQVESVKEDIQPFERGCLTQEDVERCQRGLPLIKYDAFLLYADEDIEYAKVMLDKLENEYNLRLVVKDRDLLSGIGFKLKAMTKLIDERCSSMIVILSNNLMKSEDSKYLLAFAQSLSIQQLDKRIIPCRFEECELPVEIRHVYFLDYQRIVQFGNFWERITKSVLASVSAPPPQKSNESVSQLARQTNRCTITEITSKEIKSATEPTITESIITEQTAIVRMSDPTTHFPGNSIENPSEGKWFISKSENSADSNICQADKTSIKPGFLSRLKKKKKWFKKGEKAVALQA